MLVPAICPNCNGMLEIDNKQEAAVCKYCSSPFIVEKAVNNYITNKNTYIQNATIISNKESAESMLEKGITQLRISRYKDASNTFKKMNKEYPGNWKGWYGFFLANGYATNDMNLTLDNSIRTIFPDNVLTDISPVNAPIEIYRIKTLSLKISALLKSTESNKMISGSNGTLFVSNK